MKAKMHAKPAETAIYLCNECDVAFIYRRGELSCPNCSNIKRGELVPINIRDNREEEDFYSAADWHGG